MLFAALLADLGHAGGPAADYLQSLVVAHHLVPVAEDSRVRFDFRGARFEVNRDHGAYRYARTRMDGPVEVVDELTNRGFTQRRDGQVVPLTQSQQTQLGNSVNSVVYFSMLPMPLTDAAVHAERLDPVVVEGRSLDRVSVRFAKEGGGDDHEDEYLYWFDSETQRLRFVAYRFHVGAGGVRFRIAKNARTVGSAVVYDYDNYSHPDLHIPLTDLPSLRAPTDGRPPLKLLSEIVLEDVRIDLAPADR